MKHLKMIVIVALLLAVCAPNVWAAPKAGKIGYVDLSSLFDKYHKTIEYDKNLEVKHNEFETQSKEKLEKIREAQGKLAALKEKEKAKLEEEIEKMKEELLEFDRQIKTDLTKVRNEKIREILLEIEKVVSDYAAKEKFSVILNDRVLIYGDETLDVTQEILTILNEEKSKK